MEIEAEDAVVPRGFAKTYTPTTEEYDRHCLTHLPYRSSCPICSIDKMFLNGKDNLADPVLVMTESESGGVWALPVKRKGNYTTYISSRIANISEKVGYARCLLKSEQEPAIMDVTTEVKRQASARNVQTDTTKVELQHEAHG